MATEELESPPSLSGLYPRALTGAAGGLTSKLPGLGGGGGGEAKLPDLEYVVRDVEVDRDHLAQYAHVCGFRVRDELPPTYLHMISFPMQMKIMTDGSFPFAVLGLVHIENAIEQTRPIRTGEKLDVKVRADNLRDHDRGRQFDLVADVTAAGERVWHSTSTYLRREGGGSGGSSSPDKKSKPPRAAALWKVDDGIGRRYAGVSGDINPIHLHALSARLFGFPKPIAHGMWLKARCLAALEGHLPEALSVHVAFKLPLLLPAKVAFSSSPADGGRDFAVHDARKGKPHLTGSVRPA